MYDVAETQKQDGGRGWFGRSQAPILMLFEAAGIVLDSHKHVELKVWTSVLIWCTLDWCKASMLEEIDDLPGQSDTVA